MAQHSLKLKTDMNNSSVDHHSPIVEDFVDLNTRFLAKLNI